MEVHVTGELAAKLTHSAAKQGRNPDDLLQDVLTSYFEEEARFIEAVKRGEDALHSGEYLTQEQVGQRLQRFLQPAA
jgi:predicted transcriptional regulator